MHNLLSGQNAGLQLTESLGDYAGDSVTADHSWSCSGRRKRRIVGCPLPQTPVVDGDALSSSIAAASIMAKVTRDSLMEEYAQLHPGYSFERHKGYGTAGHIDTLGRLGPLPHRFSFAPVWIAGGGQQQLALWVTRDKAREG